MHFNILVYQLFWRYLQQFRRRSVGRRRFCAFWSSRSRVRVLVCRFGPLLLLAFALLLLRPATRLFVRRVFFEYTTYPADGVYTNRQSIPPELRATHRSVALGTPLFGGGDWPVSSNERPFVSCDEPRCVLQLETADADAVVYHSYDLFYFPWIFASLWLRSFWRPGPAPGAHGGDDEDETRSGRQRQKLVLYNLEPPTRWGRNAWLLNGIFDWVAFYRADSDIPLRYMFFKFVPINGSLQSAQTPKRGPGAVAAASLQVPRNYAAGRTRLAFIITSHCEVPSDRLAFIHSLQTSLVALRSNPKPKSSAERSHRSSASYSSATPEERLALARASRVDVLGGCGRTCARDSHDCDVATLARSYKFYLALENARCTDYITEKFWDRGLWHELVPIVNGGTGPEDYLRAGAPPHSFIHVSSFASVGELAAKLLALDRDDAAYNAYFAWRAAFTLRTSMQHWIMCALCSRLHRPDKVEVEVEDRAEAVARGDGAEAHGRQKRMTRPSTRVHNDLSELFDDRQCLHRANASTLQYIQLTWWYYSGL